MFRYNQNFWTNPLKVLRMSAVARPAAGVVWRVDLAFRGAGTVSGASGAAERIELETSKESRREDSVTRGRRVRVLELGIIPDAFGIEGGQQIASRPSVTPSRIWVVYLTFHQSRGHREGKASLLRETAQKRLSAKKALCPGLPLQLPSSGFSARLNLATRKRRSLESCFRKIKVPL